MFFLIWPVVGGGMKVRQGVLPHLAVVGEGIQVFFLIWPVVGGGMKVRQDVSRLANSVVGYHARSEHNAVSLVTCTLQ